MVVGEVARQPLPRRTARDGPDEELTADEGAPPGRAEAAEELVAVAAGAGVPWPTLNARIWGASRSYVAWSSVERVATSAPFEAFMAASSSASVSTRTIVSTGPKGSAWWSGEDGGGFRRVTGWTYAPVSWPGRKRASPSHSVQRYGAPVDGLGDLVGQLLGLGRVDDGPEVQLRVRVVGVLHGQRVADPERADRRKVRGQELVEQCALDDEARVRRAALFAVVEELGNDGGEGVPVGVVPDAPGVQALLFQYVAFAEVGDGGGHGGAGVAAADEGDTADLGGADQRLGQFASAAADEGDREALAGGERVGQGEAGDPAVGRGLGDDRVARQCLDQHRVHEHAHRVVPAGDVGDRAVERDAPLDHGLDAVDVPADAVDGPVHVGLREPPGFADLPDQEQSEQFAVLGEGVERGGDPGAAFVEGDVAPGPVLVEEARTA